jgi:nucleoside-diphosphate-sugar epimerase
MDRSVLILGSSGRFGRHAAAAFGAAGWTVRRFDRSRDDLDAAARGAGVIVNAWNPPYPDWARLLPGLHAKVIAAARGAGATVIVPGNVYVFGAQTPGPWSETTPHRATNPLGRLRIEMEAAYRDSDVRTIVLRAGDFLDTRASGNWFDAVMAKNLRGGRLSYPGDPGIDHAWAFLPDLARAAVALADCRDRLPVFADIPFPGLTISGANMAETLERATGRPVRLRRMSWLPLHLARPVWPMARCLVEMRYLWDTPHRLDGARLRALLPDFQVSPAETALAAAAAPLIGGT